jgi:hypothetical protein
MSTARRVDSSMKKSTSNRWQHHVAVTAVAHAYIQRERMSSATGLTFPAVRAIVQEIFTALLFAAKPQYMHWME